MIITIQANLTNEQALILAKEKGYNQLVIETEVVETTDENWELKVDLINREIENPESCFEFLKRKYEEMITTDATNHFINVESRNITELQRLKEIEIRGLVTSGITSYVE